MHRGWVNRTKSLIMAARLQLFLCAYLCRQKADGYGTDIKCATLPQYRITKQFLRPPTLCISCGRPPISICAEE